MLFILTWKSDIFFRQKEVEHLWNAKQHITVQYLRVLFNCKVNINQHYDKASCKALSIINGIRRDIESWTREKNSLSLLYAAHTLPGVLHPGVNVTFESCAKKESIAVKKGFKRWPVGNSKMNGELFNQEKRILKWHTTVDFKHCDTATQRTKGAHLFLCNVHKIISVILQNTNMCMCSQPCELWPSYLTVVAENNKVHVSLFCSVTTKKWLPATDYIS